MGDEALPASVGYLGTRYRYVRGDVVGVVAAAHHNRTTNQRRRRSSSSSSTFSNDSCSSNSTFSNDSSSSNNNNNSESTNETWLLNQYGRPLARRLALQREQEDRLLFERYLRDHGDQGLRPWWHLPHWDWIQASRDEYHLLARWCEQRVELEKHDMIQEVSDLDDDRKEKTRVRRKVQCSQ